MKSLLGLMRKECWENNRLARVFIATAAWSCFSMHFSGAGEQIQTGKEQIHSEPKVELFREREWQIDLFGLGDFYKGADGNFSGSVTGEGGESRQFSGRPGWGLGLGVSYFFMRYVGVGFEQDVFGRDGGRVRDGDFAYVRWASIGNIFLRYPAESWRLAPYLMVGGGAMYGSIPDMTGKVSGYRARYRLSGQGFGHVGGGVEYRITPNAGLFTDARYLFSGVDGLPDAQMLWRFGVRLAF
jgi:hypothetical protein